jgi:hypothetical protein
MSLTSAKWADFQRPDLPLLADDHLLPPANGRHRHLGASSIDSQISLP